MEPLQGIYLVDHDHATQTHLHRLLSENGYHVIPFDTADDFLSSARVEPPSCVLLNMCLPDRSGFDVLALLRSRRLQIPVIFTAVHCEITECVMAMKAGVVDLLTKPIYETQLLEAITCAHAISADWHAARIETSATRALLSRLTIRERQVLALLIVGLRNKQIASALLSREATVKVHRCRLMRKLEVRSLVELARFSSFLDPGEGTHPGSGAPQSDNIDTLPAFAATDGNLRRSPVAEAGRYRTRNAAAARLGCGDV